MTLMRSVSLRGRVIAFDPVVGIGNVELLDGRISNFHATALADGSRRIGIGAEVNVTLRASANGRWESRNVTLHTPSFPCPVCRRAVPGDAAAYEVCPCCGWEDDPVQSLDPSYAGGANGSSLDEARARGLLRE